MNIVYLPQVTNIEIRDKNPFEYLLNYDQGDFEQILETRCISLEVLAWARNNEMPANAFDIFIEERTDLIIKALQRKLQGIKFEVIDTVSDAENL